MEQYKKPLVCSKYEAVNGIIPLAAAIAGAVTAIGGAVSAIGGAVAGMSAAEAAAAGVAAGLKAVPLGSRDNHLILTRSTTLQEA